MQTEVSVLLSNIPLYNKLFGFSNFHIQCALSDNDIVMCKLYFTPLLGQWVAAQITFRLNV